MSILLWPDHSVDNHLDSFVVRPYFMGSLLRVDTTTTCMFPGLLLLLHPLRAVATAGRTSGATSEKFG